MIFYFYVKKISPKRPSVLQNIILSTESFLVLFLLDFYITKIKNPQQQNAKG